MTNGPYIVDETCLVVDWINIETENEELRAENEKLLEDNEKLRREAVIRIDQITREQEAHLRTIADYNRAAVKIEKLRLALKPFAYYASQIPDDVSNTASASGTVGDLRAAAAAIRGSGE